MCFDLVESSSRECFFFRFSSFLRNHFCSHKSFFFSSRFSARLSSLCLLAYWTSLHRIRDAIDATHSFKEYHWRENGLKGSLTEFLRVCWENQEQKISSDPELQKVFLSLLITLSSHGDHAIIALRDHILNSISSK